MSSPTAPVSGDAQRMMLFEANKKSVGLAYVLWFFLGLVGGHRFYAGRAGSGVAMLVITLLSFFLMAVVVGFFTLAITGIWALVDAFLIGGWIRDYNNRLVVGLSR